MFCVDEPTADAIRQAFDESGELAAIAELRRHFPLMASGDLARECVRAIASWQPPQLPAVVHRSRKPPRRH